MAVDARSGPAAVTATGPAFLSKTAAPAAPPAATTPAARLPAPSTPAPAVSTATLLAAPPAALPDQNFTTVPVAGGIPAYPVELAAEGRPGRVNVTCQIAADGSPSGCRAAASRGGPAFAAATLAWLAHAHVRFHPIILHGHPVAATRSWTVVIEEPAGLLAEAKRKQLEADRAEQARIANATAADAKSGDPRLQSAAAAEPAQSLSPGMGQPVVQPIVARQVIATPPNRAVDRPFSTSVIAGGAPGFPAPYDDSRPGAVTVTCMVDEGGVPAACHVIKAVGGSAFGKAVKVWLGSGRVRFRPLTSGGQPVAREETWTIVFNNEPSAQ